MITIQYHLADRKITMTDTMPEAPQVGDIVHVDYVVKERTWVMYNEWVCVLTVKKKGPMYQVRHGLIYTDGNTLQQFQGPFADAVARTNGYEHGLAFVQAYEGKWFSVADDWKLKD